MQSWGVSVDGLSNIFYVFFSYNDQLFQGSAKFGPRLNVVYLALETIVSVCSWIQTIIGLLKKHSLFNL